jgi:hypothetical protein
MFRQQADEFLLHVDNEQAAIGDGQEFGAAD